MKAWSFVIGAALLGLHASRVPAAVAGDALGPYLGVAAGFEQTHPAWQVMLGARPIEFVAFELAYANFGNASVAGPPGVFFGYFKESLKQDAATLFLVGYLPLPVRFLEVYGKGGIARLHSDSQVTTLPPGCPAPGPCLPFTIQSDSSSTDFAYGAGLQARFGSLAVRLDYEQIRASVGNPHMFSVGANWTF